MVDDRMRTSLPDVFAAGDCIAPHHLVLGRPAFVPLGRRPTRRAAWQAPSPPAGTPAFAGGWWHGRRQGIRPGGGPHWADSRRSGKCGLPAVATDAVGRSRAKYYPGAEPVTVRLVHEPGGRLLGAQMIGVGEAWQKRIDVVAVALQAGFDVDDLLGADLSYAPPYAPVLRGRPVGRPGSGDERLHARAPHPATISPLDATVGCRSVCGGTG